MTTELTPRVELDLDELGRLEREAFRAPWTYDQWEVECSACEGGTNEPETGCPNPDCNGANAPIVAVEAPEEYPNGQLVAQISVPGLLSLADKNGAMIAQLRNAAPELLRRASQLAAVEAFLREHGEHLRAAAEFTAAGIETEMPGHAAARDALTALLLSLGLGNVERDDGSTRAEARITATGIDTQREALPEFRRADGLAWALIRARNEPGELGPTQEDADYSDLSAVLAAMPEERRYAVLGPWVDAEREAKETLVAEAEDRANENARDLFREKRCAESAEARASLAERLAGERKQELSYAHQEKLGLEEELEVARARVGVLTDACAAMHEALEDLAGAVGAHDADVPQDVLDAWGPADHLLASISQKCTNPTPSAPTPASTFAAVADALPTNAEDERIVDELVAKRTVEARAFRSSGTIKVTREPGCRCHWEEGDSPCPVHGENEESTPRSSGEATGTENAARAEYGDGQGVAPARPREDPVGGFPHRFAKNVGELLNEQREGQAEATTETPHDGGKAVRTVPAPESGARKEEVAEGEVMPSWFYGFVSWASLADVRSTYQLTGPMARHLLARAEKAHSEGAKAAKAKARRSEFYDKRDWEREAQETIDEEGWPSRDRAAAYLAVCMSESWIDGHHWTLGQAAKAEGWKVWERIAIARENAATLVRYLKFANALVKPGVSDILTAAEAHEAELKALAAELETPNA